MKILVRSPNWIGDQIMAFPFFYMLRARYPSAWIGVVCNEWVKDIQFSGLVDEVFSFEKRVGVWDSFIKMVSLSKKIRKAGPWDLGISLPNSFGSALLLKMASVKERRGYNADARGMLLTQGILWDSDPNIHRVEAYGRLLPVEAKPEWPMNEFWKASGEKKFDVISNWPHAKPLDPPQEKYWVVAPGAVADSRRWSAEQYADLIRLIQAELGYKAVMIGGKAEKEIANYFELNDVPFVDFTMKGPVAGLWKLFRDAQFTVCNESGLAHVASLCGSKVWIVCGAADPKRTQPIGPGRVSVITNPVECWPCEKNTCEFTDNRRNQCLNGIFPREVLEGIRNAN